MNLVKIFVSCLIASMLCACGTGEFFIKRAINGLQEDVADQFKGYADFGNEQEQQIDAIAQQVDTWVRTDRLPVLYGELEKMALDIEQTSQISGQTWSSTVALLEQPMNLATQGNVIDEIALVVHGMSDEQRKQAIKKIQKDYKKSLKDQQKITLENQNKKLSKGFKVVFSELGIGRTKAQMTQAKAMLAQRKSHIELDNQASERDQNAFIKLIGNTQDEQSAYIAKFVQAWTIAEQGAKDQAPQLWEHNAKIAFDVLNYLLSDLDQEQRNRAAKKIRDYADLFRALSRGNE